MTQVFISYSTVDKDFADRLADDLRQAGIGVWKTPESILPGEEWVDAIQRGLGSSTHFALIVSPAAARSGWVKFEMHTAIRLQVAGKIVIIPVDYRPCLDAPLFWGSYHWVDARQDEKKGLLELIGRVNCEQPAHPPATASVAATTSGDVGRDVLAAGGDIHVTYNIYDQGRPEAPPPPPVEILPTEPTETPQPPTIAKPPARVRHTGAQRAVPLRRKTGRDPILDILPPPFEWCDIPAGRVTLMWRVALMSGYTTGRFEVGPFKMAKYPVTYAQFQVFIDAKDGFHNPKWWAELAADTENKRQPGDQAFKVFSHPRETVSWYDAMAFACWLSRKVGYEVRLPTEWEWQWAAQGPKGRKYPWGNKFASNRCNFHSAGTTPVTQYPDGESPFHVWDMSGNVWEWCLNEYFNPGIIDAQGYELKAARGGAWYFDNPDGLRAARRGGFNPLCRDNYLGLRLACSS